MSGMLSFIFGCMASAAVWLLLYGGLKAKRLLEAQIQADAFC